MTVAIKAQGPEAVADVVQKDEDLKPLPACDMFAPCASDETLDSINCVCVKNCTLFMKCSANHVADPKTCTCICPQRYRFCFKGFVWDDTTCKCGLPRPHPIIT